MISSRVRRAAFDCGACSGGDLGVTTDHQDGDRAVQPQPESRGVPGQRTPLGLPDLLLDLDDDAVHRLTPGTEHDHRVGVEVHGRPVVEVAPGQLHRSVAGKRYVELFPEELHGELGPVPEQ
ncbi:hypothetical protein [Sphaerisporangium aureirubrum]|uniref:Uncharacterized protein n=1 Tax=Sphaerisporangium aureirubrum TaxID=1544736 RepID=A0ABW1NSJ7_9ACTN